MTAYPSTATTVKIATQTEVAARFSEYVKAAENDPVVVTRNGRPVAGIVGVQDEIEIERLLMAYSPHLRAILDRWREQFQEGKSLGEEDFRSQFERAKPAKRSAKPKKRAG